MPYINEFRTNEDLLQEVLRIKKSKVVPMITPKIPNSVKTTQPTKGLNVKQWFDFICRRLRIKDAEGFVGYPQMYGPKEKRK